MIRHAAKRDENELAIVAALEAAGVHVWRLHTPCDLLCFRLGRFYPLEVKTEDARPRKDQEAQTEFLRITGTPIVRTVGDALRAVGAIKSPATPRPSAAGEVLS